MEITHLNMASPEVEITHLNMASGCPHSGLIKNSQTSDPLNLWNAVVNVQFVLGDSLSVQLGNMTTTATTTTTTTTTTKNKQKNSLTYNPLKLSTAVVNVELMIILNAFLTHQIPL